MTLENFRRAVDEGRVLVKTPSGWFAARARKEGVKVGDDWVVQVKAGPHERWHFVWNDPSVAREWTELKTQKTEN